MTTSAGEQQRQSTPLWPFPGPFAPAAEYLIDAAQRSVLFWDVMRQRGNQYREHQARDRAARARLSSVELVIDGRTLERPVNYVLVRIVPPQGVEIDPTPATVRRRRSARRAWPGHRRLQGRQRDRRRAQGRPSLLFRRLPAGPDAGPDDRGYRPRRSGVSRKGDRAAPARRRQALRDRQLPGRLGGHDAGRDAARTVRPDHHCRLAALLLGRRARAKPDALYRRPARRQLADRARPAISAAANSMAPGWCRISRTSTRPTRCGPSSTISMPRSTPRRRAISASSAGGAATSISTPRRSSSSSTSCSSATISQPATIKTVRRHGGRPAQHPLADRRVLLEGRQHHAAAAGAGLDSRSLRRRRRDPLLRADHRLHHPRDRRPSRHLRVGRRGAQRAWRILQQYRPDRCAAARPL